MLPCGKGPLARHFCLVMGGLGGHILSPVARSLDFPNLVLGREGVSILVGFYFTTSNLERGLKKVACRSTSSQGGGDEEFY